MYEISGGEIENSSESMASREETTIDKYLRSDCIRNLWCCKSIS